MENPKNNNIGNSGNSDLKALRMPALTRTCANLLCLVAGAFLVFTNASAQLYYTTPYQFATIAGATTNVGNVDQTGSAAAFDLPEGLTIGTNGYLYAVDNSANTVRQIARVGSDWQVKTIAGTAYATGHGDGTGQGIQFNGPVGIAADGSNNLYVVDLGNNIRKLTYVGGSWMSSTIAGVPNGPAGYVDGTNGTAQFYNPYSIAADSAGNLYVADTLNNLIRKVTPMGTNWVVTTIAGDTNDYPNNSGSADGTNFGAAFSQPYCIVVDTASNLFVSDGDNGTIRKITPVGTNWVVTTIAGGTSFPPYNFIDGTNRDAWFNNPFGLAVDANDNIYVSDTFNNAIRKISPVGTNWVTTTLGGNPNGNAGDGDLTGMDASFNNPWGIAVDTAGNVYVADTLNHEIRAGNAPTFTISLAGLNSVQVTWPIAFGILQTNSSLSGGSSWGNYLGPVNDVNGTNVVTISPAVGTLFFRLSE